MPPPRYWTEDRIVEAVIYFMEQEGRSPRYKEFAKAHGLPDRRIVERRMRTWQNAIRQAQDVR